MNIEKHIRQLLFEQNCVIIPEFGGFIANYVSAEIHPIRHVFAPPSKYIAFNELLKVNDGLLISHISSNEEISRDEAAKAIKEFVQKVTEEINSNKKYYFEEIGTLYYNHEQKLQFDPDKTVNYLSASFGLPDLQFKPIERQNVYKTKDRPAIKTETNEKIQENALKELKEQRRKSFSKLQAAIIPVLIFLAVAFGYFSFLDNGNNALSNFNPLPALFPQLFNKQKTVLENKKIAVVPPEKIVENKEGKTDMIANETTTEKENNAVVEKEIKHEALIIKKEKHKVSKTEIVKAGVLYYVIVGGFGSEANAEKLVAKLKSQGHDGAKVLPPTDNNLFKVSSGDFTNMQEANNEVSSVKNEFAGAWVYKK